MFAFSPVHAHDRWSLVGPGKWYVLTGAILGFLLGLSFAKWLWSVAVDQVEVTAGDWGFWLMLVAIVVVVVILLFRYFGVS